MADEQREKERKQFGARLRLAREKAGVSQQHIAKKLRLSKQLVSHWETGRSEITVFHAVKVASIVSADIGWLLTGIGEGQDADSKSYPAVGRLVPKLTAEQLIDLALGRIQLSDATEMCVSYGQASQRALSFAVFDRSMEPRFPTDSVVTIDPEQLPEPGDCIVVVLLASREVLFGRYRPKPETRSAQPPFTIRFDNQDYEARLITLVQQPVYIGTMVEHLVMTSR